MTERYLRSVAVSVGDGNTAIKITDLLISFRIRREASSTPAEGHVDIYNLTEIHEKRIKERGEKIRLEAGYADQLNLVFDGDVRRVERQRHELDRVTRIYVGGNVFAQTVSIFVRSYEGEVSVRDIVRDGVETLELELGPIDLIPADAVETDFRYNGSTRVLLSQRLEPLGMEWYEDNGVVRFSRIGMTADDRPQGVTVSERTGMIGTPTITDDGIRVATLLDSRLRIDTRLQVESEFIEPGEQWKIVSVEHSGDNREGKFISIVEARPLDA